MTQAHSSTPAPDYDQLEAALRQGGSDTDAAECQGRLCAVMCVRGDADRGEWLDHTLPELDPRDLLAGGARELAGTLYDYTRAGLADPLFDFQLVLPDDEVPIAGRTRALGEWCQGFLGGLAESGVRDLDTLPGELPEVVHDLVEIAQAGQFEVSDDEEDEAAYAELVEYVRMAVLLVREELQPRAAPPAGDATLH